MISPTPQGHTTPRAPHILIDPYVPLPAGMIDDLAESPLAIGVYALISRLFYSAREPVALSEADIARYDPSLKRGAVRRAFDHLLGGSWLIAEGKDGLKGRYTPTWGLVAGEARPWQLNAPLLGRPRRHQEIRLCRRLLDTYMGRLITQPRRPARVERYVSRPLLSLRDIGTYAQLLRGEGISTPALRAWGLALGDQPLTPPDDTTILAAASQRALVDADDISLTPHAYRHLGISNHTSAAAPAPTTPGQLLLYLPPDMAGDMIGQVAPHLIGDAPDSSPPAAHCDAECAPPLHAPTITGNLREKREKSESPPTPLSPATTLHGGGDTAAIAIELSETTHLLTTLGIQPRIITELADLPPDVVQAAIREERQRPDLIRPGAWTVTLLRSYRNGRWQPLTLPPIPTVADASVPLLTAGDTDAPALPAIRAYISTFGISPTPEQRDAICTAVADITRWRQDLQRWKLNGYRPQSVEKLLDFHTHQGKPNDSSAPTGSAYTLADLEAISAVNADESLTLEERQVRRRAIERQVAARAAAPPERSAYTLADLEAITAVNADESLTLEERYTRRRAIERQVAGRRPAASAPLWLSTRTPPLADAEASCG
ncbi:MAG: hypothetical protein HGB28_02055 [Oscillochloris sp.]|nr:hypothetical protein [Oscillochloris sp.]